MTALGCGSWDARDVHAPQLITPDRVVTAHKVVDAVDREVVAQQVVGNDERRDVDLGQLKQGDSLEHTFTLRNTTDAAFAVTAIKKSCGCETAKLDAGTVIPAGDARDVFYSVPGYVPGDRVGRLVLTTNSADESFQEIILTLRARVQAMLWAEPSSLDFGLVKPGESPELELRVKSIVPGLPDRLREVTSSRDHVAINLEQQSPTLLVFRVTLAEGSVDGNVYDLISLHFNDRSLPRLSVRVRAKGAAAVKTPQQSMEHHRS